MLPRLSLAKPTCIHFRRNMLVAGTKGGDVLRWRFGPNLAASPSVGVIGGAADPGDLNGEPVVPDEPVKHANAAAVGYGRGGDATATATATASAAHATDAPGNLLAAGLEGGAVVLESDGEGDSGQSGVSFDSEIV